MKLVYSLKLDQKSLHKIIYGILLMTVLIHLTSNSLLSENQVKISLSTKAKKFSQDIPSLILTHQKHNTFDRHLNDHNSQIEEINKYPKISSDEYDEVTGVTETLKLKNNSNRCNREILNNYLISGYDSPQLENHKFCPNITFNCCTEKDQNATMENWNTIFRTRIQKYYSVYINSIRFLLGYYEQFNIIAADLNKNLDENFVPGHFNSTGEAHQVDPVIQQRMNSHCIETARNFLDFKFDKSLMLLILNRAIRLTSTFIKLRSSFFCTLCDGQAQEMLKGFWQGGNSRVKETMFFSRDFCEQFVEETIDGAFNYSLYLTTYLNHIKKLSDCKLGEKSDKFKDLHDNLRMEFNKEADVDSIKECFDNKDNGVLPHCEKYCNQFNLSFINKTIEGDTVKLYKFVNFVSLRRYSIFKNQTNIFTEDVAFLRTQIEMDFEGSKDLYMFFNPSHQKKLLDEMDSDVVSLGGINPFDSGNDNMYLVVLAGVEIISVILGIMSVLLWK